MALIKSQADDRDKRTRTTNIVINKKSLIGSLNDSEAASAGEIDGHEFD